MSLEAGSVFARLSAIQDESGKSAWRQWDAQFTRSEEKAAKPVIGKLGAHVDAVGFSKFDQAMNAAARQKATGQIDVNDGPARVKIDTLKRLVGDVKKDIDSRKEFHMETGVARAELRLLQGEIRKTEREAARVRLAEGAGGGLFGGGRQVATAAGGAGGGGGLPLGGAPLAIGAGVTLGGPVIGSASAGILGAGVLGAGAIGAGATGLGALMAVMKPAQDEAKKVAQAYQTLNMATLTYGAGSTQAATAQVKLNAVLQNSGPAAAKAGKAAYDFGNAWQDGTQKGQAAVQRMQTNVFGFLTKQIPLIDKLGAQSANAIRKNFLGPLERTLGGKEMHHIFSSLGGEFSRLTGPLGKSTSNFMLAFGRLAVAAEPYVTKLARGIEHFAHGLLALTGDKGKLDSFVSSVVGQFRAWWDLTTSLSKVLFDLFKTSADSGKGVVENLTKILNHWDKWLNSATGTREMKSFWSDVGVLTRTLLGTLAPMVAIFADFARNLMPAVAQIAKTMAPELALVAKAFGDMGKGITWLVNNVPGFKQFAATAATLAVAYKGMQFVGMLTGLTKVAGAYRAIGVAAAAATVAEEAGVKASIGQRLAASIVNPLSALKTRAAKAIAMFRAWLVLKSAEAGAAAGVAEAEAQAGGPWYKTLLAKGKASWAKFAAWLYGAAAVSGATAGAGMAGANGLGSSKVLGKLKSIGKIGGRLVGLGIAGGLLLALPQIVGSLNKIGPVISDWAAKNIPGVKAIQDSGVVKSIRHATDPANKAIVNFMGQINPFGKAAGGPIDPGSYGGGDRHVRVLESGEYVLRKEAVAKHGPGFVDALNRGRNPAADGILTAAAVLVDAARSMGAQNPLGSISTLGAKASGAVTIRTGGLFMAAGGMVSPIGGLGSFASHGPVDAAGSAGDFAATAQTAAKAGDDVQKGWGTKLKDTIKQSLQTTAQLRKDGGEHFDALRKTAVDDATGIRDDVLHRFTDTHKKGSSEFAGLKGDVLARIGETRKSIAGVALGISGDVTARFTETRTTAGRATKGLRDDTTVRFGQARTSASQSSKGLRDDVSAGFAAAEKSVGAHTGSMASLTRTNMGAAQQAGSSLASKLAQAIAGSFGSADTAVYTATGYVEQAVDAALKGFGAKAASFTIPKPAGISAHATGGIPNPGAGSRDDHLLLDPTGRPVAALSGSEGIVNTPQMGVIDRALGIAKALGGSAFGSLGELWGSGLTHHAKGGVLGETPMQRASQLAQMQLPYVWGGHHGDSAPILDPRPGLDCSSAVSYVLGIPPMVSGSFESYGKPGAGPITLYANPEHIFMSLAGRGFGTGHGAGHNPAGGGGPGWLSYNSMPGFTVRHVDGSPGSGADIPRVKVSGPAGALRSLGQSAVDKVRGAGLGYITRQLAKLNSVSGQPLNEPGGAGPASGWTDQAMALAGVSGSLWKQMLMRQEMRESSYSPNPPNINDINTAQGNPSRGILQTTGTTFKQYMVAGHGNILNPVDNIAAAIRYMIATYGHGNAGAAAQTMWGRGGGAYGSGGLLRFARGGRLGRYGGLSQPRRGSILPPHFGSSLPSQRARTIYAHHHAVKGRHGATGHLPLSSPSQPQATTLTNRFLGDFQHFGGLPAFLTPNTSQIAADYLHGVGLGDGGAGMDPLTQSLIGAGTIPGLTPLDQTDRALQADTGHLSQLQAQLQADEPGGQLSQADYQQLEGVAQYGVSGLEGERSTITGEYQVVSGRYARDEGLIGRITGRSTHDANRVKALQALLTRQQRNAQTARHKLRANVLAEADRIAGLESKNYDAMQKNAAATRAIRDAIAKNTDAQRRIRSEPPPDFAGQGRNISASYDQRLQALDNQISRLPGGAYKQSLQRQRRALAAQRTNALRGHGGKAYAWHEGQRRRLAPLRSEAERLRGRLHPVRSEAIRLQRAHHGIAVSHNSAERKYHRLGWSRAWAFTRRKWGIQDKIKQLQAEVKGLNEKGGPLALATAEASQLDAAATVLITRAQALPDQIVQAQGQVGQFARGALSPQLLTPGQTNTLTGLTEAMALADVSSDPAANDEQARVGLQGFWQSVLGGLESEHAPAALIMEAAGNLKGFLPQGGPAAGGATAGPSIAEQVRAQMTTFDDAQRSLYQTFGANALPSLSGATPGGMRDFGAAGGAAFAGAGLGPAGDTGKTVVVQDGGSFVQLNHAPPVSDPHQHAALSRFAFETSFG